MRPNLRIAAEFNHQISPRFASTDLSKAIIIDDSANLIHTVYIEYDEVGDQAYRRLTYVIVAMQSLQEVLTVHNDMAEQLLYRFSQSLSGSNLGNGRLFEPGMFQAGRDKDGNPLAWDDVMPSDPVRGPHQEVGGLFPKEGEDE